jgi:hypothetical protein
LWLTTDILGVQMASPANTFPALIPATGGIWRDFPNFDLAPNQALVITTNLAGAAYFGIPVQNIWTVSADYWDHQTSLTNAQALPNPDGTYTFVVSSRDPGVYNWVDTTGLQQGTMVLRWQGVPVGNVPSVSGQVVDLSNLSSVLPAGTVFVTPAQRAAQLAQREAGFEGRVAPQARHRGRLVGGLERCHRPLPRCRYRLAAGIGSHPKLRGRVSWIRPHSRPHGACP